MTLLPGTAATMDFNNNLVSGSSSCNTYQASYSVNGNAISVSPPSSTSLFCADPPGIMDQEAGFLAALQSVAIFRINGNQLEIQNGAGQISIVANRAP